MPNEVPIQNEIAATTEVVSGITITDTEGHEIAQNHFKHLAGMEREVRGLFADSKTKANAAHRAVCAAEKKLLIPILDLKAKLQALISAYQREAAEREAAERRRLEAEAREVEQARLQAEAVAAEALGEKEVAEHILEEAIAAPAPVVAPTKQTAKVEGVSSRELWQAEVTSLQLLIRHAADNPQWSHLLNPNMPAINAIARSMKSDFRIPGLRVFSKTSTAVRRS